MPPPPPVVWSFVGKSSRSSRSDGRMSPWKPSSFFWQPPPNDRPPPSRHHPPPPDLPPPTPPRARARRYQRREVVVRVGDARPVSPRVAEAAVQQVVRGVPAPEARVRLARGSKLPVRPPDAVLARHREPQLQAEPRELDAPREYERVGGRERFSARRKTVDEALDRQQGGRREREAAIRHLASAGPATLVDLKVRRRFRLDRCHLRADILDFADEHERRRPRLAVRLEQFAPVAPAERLDAAREFRLDFLPRLDLDHGRVLLPLLLVRLLERLPHGAELLDDGDVLVARAHLRVLRVLVDGLLRRRPVLLRVVEVRRHLLHLGLLELRVVRGLGRRARRRRRRERRERDECDTARRHRACAAVLRASRPPPRQFFEGPTR
mmetsp:Transcript_16246/g.48921  ORF Transcript_16246/g.48921 Transcript_16246/m.48921 type:complete len:381 (-) Transcript_16246:142-1284(-)